MTEPMRPEDARRALSDHDRAHGKVFNSAVPRWIFPSMGAVFAVFFVIEAYGAPRLRHLAETLTWLSYLAFLVGFLMERRRERTRVTNHRELLPPASRRLSFGFALSILVLLAIAALMDMAVPSYLIAAYGIALGAYTALGGLLVHRSLRRRSKTRT